MTTMLVPNALLISSFDLNHAANIVKGYALAIGVVFAMWIVWTWWARKLKVDKLEAQVRAKQAFARFTHQGMAAPELSIPVAADGGPARARYQKYMELLLTTADEIVMLDPSPQWRAVLGRQLAPHVEYLGSAGFREGLYTILSADARDLVDKVVAPTPAAGPAPASAANVRQLRSGQV